ncbi:hypothetical protein RN251_004438 [Salmonella enterica]|nr:hypothetical protein [Salmonella enterica]
MDSRQKKLVLSVINNKPIHEGKVSDEDFLAEFPSGCDNVSEFVTKLLIESCVSMDAQCVELSLYVGFHFGFSGADELILDKLLVCDFHYRHDEIVRALVLIGASTDETVDALSKCALTEFDYLSDDRDDGIYTLSWNCIYALAKIATPYAINKLKWLSECDIQEIKDKAVDVIKKYKINIM